MVEEPLTIPLAGEVTTPLQRDVPGGDLADTVAMSSIIEIAEAVPVLRWLATPAGVAVFAGLLVLVMSGVVGRMVLSVEALISPGRAGRAAAPGGRAAAAGRGG